MTNCCLGDLLDHDVCDQRHGKSRKRRTGRTKRTRRTVCCSTTVHEYRQRVLLYDETLVWKKLSGRR
ncbi:hypothetical protein CRM22_005935 [Opisthorchis felineus]|uniref:Uncharacterized protein n=1 Tax=Opisthorchis felineus TaxID=147828 RepID=A0A4S2LVN2_OPIFE|nr:hypothetical protein CRM22_005935 [Opisthorchis felineus]